MLYGSVLKVTREDTIEDIEKIFMQMKECNFDTVVIWPAAFWWEEKGDNYPFSTGIKILETAKKCGIGVIMELAGQLTAMEYMPDFKFKDEYYASTNEGHIEYGQPSFGFLNYFHPEVNSIICEHFKKAAEAYKNCDALLGYDVFNETMFRSFDSYTIKEFRKWLKEKYVTIEKLNQVWERTYSSWEQITYQNWKWMSIMPETDYAAFRKASITRFMKNWCDAIKSVDKKHVLIADNIHSMVTTAGDYDRPQDDFALKEIVDEIGMSFYPKGVKGCFEPALRWQIFDGFYSASRGEGYLISEMQTHIQALFNPTTAVRTYELKQWCMEAIASGAKGIIYWMWRPFTKGLQTLGRGIVDYKSRPTERFETAKEVYNSIKNKGKLKPVRSKIGIVYNDKCEDFQKAYTKAYDVDQSIYLRSVFGAYKAMFDNNIHCDIVKLENIESYKAIILTNHIILGKNDAARLKKYADNGGIVIIDGKFGQVDEESMLNGNLPGGDFNDYIGSEYIDSDYKNLNFEYKNETVKGYYNKNIVEVKDAETISIFEDGLCAVSRKGNVITINTDIWYGYAETEDVSIRNFANTLVETLKLKDIKTMSDIKLRVCEDEENYVIFAFNYSDEDKNIKATVFDYNIELNVKANDVELIEVRK